MSSFSIPPELLEEVSDCISSDVIERAAEIAQDAFIRVACDVGRTPAASALGHFISIRKHFDFVFRSVLRDKIEDVLSAASITPEMLDMQRAYAEIEEFKATKRKAIAKQLRSNRVKLRKLRSEVRMLESRGDALHKTIEALAAKVPGKEFRCAPPPMLTPTKGGEGIPRKPGIYFVWLEGLIVYVGKSTNLKGRITLSHQNIYPRDMISFIECEASMLDYMESMYIGAYMPNRNFGRGRRRNG